MTRLYGALSHYSGPGFGILSSESLGSWLIPKSEVQRWLDDNDSSRIAVSFQLADNAKWLRARPCEIVPVPDRDLLLPNAAELRRYIDLKKRWELFELALIENEPIKYLWTLLSEVDQEDRCAFWQICPNSITIDSPIYDIADKEGKIALIRKAYATMCTLPPVPGTPVTNYAETVVQMLEEKDLELAKEWSGEANDSDEYRARCAKMISARAAEKGFAKLLRALGYKVEDISIGQLSSGTGWWTHDLFLEDTYAIDVKNSRTTYRSDTMYVEHNVARFKSDRSGKDVFLAGVISPYLSFDDLEEILGKQKITGIFPARPSYKRSNNEQNRDAKKSKRDYNRYKEFIFLGLTTKQAIKKLEQRFHTSVLQLKLVGDDNDLEDGNSTETLQRIVIPPWSYELPRKYYIEVDKAFETINQLQEAHIPTFQMLKEANLRAPYGLFIAGHRPIPLDWLEGVEPWQRDFLEEVQKHGKLTLPNIYLSILRHFTTCIQAPPSSYNPKDYVDLIFYRSLPLGKTDPIGVVKGLIANLAKVWNRRDSIGLNRFHEFRFQGLGILRARPSPEDKFVTLIAYCGGINEKKVKCGYSPLVYGDKSVEACDSCGRLICPRCGYCYKYCELNVRQVTWDSLETFENETYVEFAEGPPDFIDLMGDDLNDMPF